MDKYRVLLTAQQIAELEYALSDHMLGMDEPDEELMLDQDIMGLLRRTMSRESKVQS